MDKLAHFYCINLFVAYFSDLPVFYNLSGDWSCDRTFNWRLLTKCWLKIIATLWVDGLVEVHPTPFKEWGHGNTPRRPSNQASL